MHDYLTVCERAARAGGKVLLEWQGRINPREKAPKDLVTEADFASQEIIRGIIHDAFPDHDFLGEEDEGPEDAGDAEFRWIVDPLDGTVNYVHRLPTFAVSIGLERRGELVAGVIFNPVSQECFSAAVGCGANLNGRPIQVSSCESLRRALVAASLSADVERDSDQVKRYLELLVASRSLRRLGSAALNLAFVAAGRLDGYWATTVKIWDVAAGIVIVREAGGIITNLEGGPISLSRPHLAAASTKALHSELVTALDQATSRG